MTARLPSKLARARPEQSSRQAGSKLVAAGRQAGRQAGSSKLGRQAGSKLAGKQAGSKLLALEHASLRPPSLAPRREQRHRAHSHRARQRPRRTTRRTERLLTDARALCRGGGEAGGDLSEAAALWVLHADRFEQRRHRRLLEQGDGAAAEAAARHAATVDALDAHGDLHQHVKLGAGDLIVVAKGDVALVHELAHAHVVPRLERRLGLERPLVFGNAVRCTLDHLSRQAAYAALEHCGRGVAQEVDLRVTLCAHGRTRLLALADAVRVLRA
mmetsp:Transcript_14177/g.33439  ORF Transcript_14177/g.33439 Transcript_14177/m.33439 type:complete len:272 (-) Transcript_14177:730-1545(-)